MIDPEYCRVLASYNRWQNASLFSAADGLSDAERRRDRGAFFASVHGTLSHLLWADTMWMSRIDGWDAPKVGLSESAGWVADWDELSRRRMRADERIFAWGDGLDEGALEGELSWYSGVLDRRVSRPLAFCIAHFFNHQTHHRGQVHAMLTAAGARPGDTDLLLMPRDT